MLSLSWRDTQEPVPWACRQGLGFVWFSLVFPSPVPLPAPPAPLQARFALVLE